MKASCNREGLLTAFQVACSVVPARSPKPILRHVRFELLEDGVCELMATDLELGLRYRVSGVQGEQAGQAILPSSEVLAILRELPDEQIVIESTENGVRIAGAASKFELASEDPLQFPEVPSFGEAEGHKVKSSVLATLIRRTIFAAAQENSRYTLHSVLIEFGQDQVTLVATDGKRLAHMPGPASIQGEIQEGIFLVPPKSLNLLQKILHDPEEEVEIGLRENEILFRTPKVTIYSRLAEGRFPRYQDVFPGEAQHRIPLLVSSFHAAIRQSRIVTDEDSKGVGFRFGSGSVILESHGTEHGDSVVQLPIGYDGEALDVTYDPGLLAEALRVLDPDEEISLDIVDTKKASVLRTSDGYAYIVMPLSRDREDS